MAEKFNRTKRKNSRQFNEQFRKRFITKKSALIWIFTLIIMLGMGIGYLNLERRADKYRRAISELNTEISDLERSNEELQEQMENIDSDEFVEQMARDHLGMVKKGEFSLRESNQE